MTDFTPGSTSAAEVSIDLMRACACGERRILPYSIPGSFRSAPYSARPVTLGTPSGRIGRVPTHLKRFTESVTIVLSFTAASLCVSRTTYVVPESPSEDGKARGTTLSVCGRFG